MASTGTVTILLISGESRQITGLQPEDLFLSLHQKIADALGLLTVEVGICHGQRKFSNEDYGLTLLDLGLLGGDNIAEIAVIRLPRLTPEVLEGSWHNSK